MKRFMILFLFVFASTSLLAQADETFFRDLTEKYANQDGFSASLITDDMFDLYLKKRKIEDSSPVYKALEDLNSVLVASQSKFSGTQVNSNKQEENSSTAKVHDFILEHYKNEKYTLFKTEKTMGEDVKVYLKKNQGIIQSLALITHSSVSTQLVELNGDIDLKTLSELSQALNLRGLENLYKINNSSRAPYGLNYPGTRYSEEYQRVMLLKQREMIEKQRQMTEKQRQMTERQARLTREEQAKIEAYSKQMAEKQMQMAEKYREMAEKYQRTPIFLSTPGDTNTVYFLNGKTVKAKEIKELDPNDIESIDIKKGKKEDEKIISIKTK